MACCALAAFVVGQLLFHLDWLRERLGLAPVAVGASESAAWRLGDAAPLAPRAASFPARRVGLSLVGGVAAFAVAYSALHPDGAHRPHALQIPYLCSSSSSLATN
jgi:hypothetical protein